jgi:hypothetical protein
MRLSIFTVGALCLGLALAPGCSDDDDPAPSGRGGSGGGTGGGGGGGGGAGSGGTGVDAGGETGATVTYAMAKAIFGVKCAPCHTTGNNVKFAVNYSDTQKTVVTGATECGASTKIGACTIKRIKSGSMPYGKMCKAAGGAPDPNACLTPAEEATIQAWVDGGLKE